MDELSGIAFVGAPEIQVAFGLSYGMTAVLLFVLPQLVSFLIEPPLFVLSDRVPRKPLVIGGLATLGACLVVAGSAPNALVLAAALAVASPASGIGVNLAQATLVDAFPQECERVLTRWAFMGGIGDLLGPAVYAGLAAWGLGWRPAFALVGVLVAAYAVALAPLRFPAPASAEREGDAPPPGPTLRVALGNRRLLGWLLGVSLCGMLDEVLVAFAALHLQATLGASVTWRSLALGGLMAGGMTGLAVSDRLLRRIDPLVLLTGSSAACAGCYAAWIATSSIASSAALLAAVGFFSSPLYPIAKAQAYRALPGRSGLVVAGAQVLAPVELAVPLVLGIAADAVGLPLALGLLLLEPLGLLLLALRSVPGRSRRS